MKTVSKFLMTLLVITAISFTGCRDSKKEKTEEEHGHSHDDDSDHSHDHEEVKQEEFTVGKDSLTVGKDSLKTKEKKHTHDNGEEHHDH